MYSAIQIFKNAPQKNRLMIKYTLNLLPEDSANKERSRNEIVWCAHKFKEQYLETHKQKDQCIDLLLRDLTQGRFWGVLSFLDGTNNPLRPDPIKKREEKREWARKNFDEYEIKTLLDICINYALLVPVNRWPGNDNGHTILYCEIAEKKDSMFASIVDEKFRKRLNNGRLWEMLPELSISLNYGAAYPVVEDVLKNNFADITPDFITKGFEIYAREKRRQVELARLSDTAIDNYLNFIKMLDSQQDEIRDNQDNLCELVTAYIRGCISSKGELSDDPGALRFEENRETPSFKQRLQEPLIVKYLERYEPVRNEIKKDLKYLLQTHKRYACEILECIPQSKKIRTELLLEK